MSYANIVTQLIALFLTIYIFVIWTLHKRIKFESENIFLIVMIVIMISEVFDIAFQVFPTNVVVNNINVSHIILKVYLVSIPTSLFVISLYANFSILNTKQFFFFRIFIVVLLVINAAIIYFLPADHIEIQSCVVPIGAAVTYTYILCAAIAAIILIELLLSRKKLFKATYIANLVWFLLVVIGGVLQWTLLPSFGIPVVSFIISLGAVAVYLVLENPGNKYDYINYRFHYETFVKYISEIIRFKDLQSILYINLTTKNDEKIVAVGDIFSGLVNQNKNNSDIKLFKGIGNELIITSKETIILQDIASTIYELVINTEKKYGVEIYASIALIPSIAKIKTYRILREILDDYKIKSNLVTENIRFFTVKDDYIERCNNDAVITSDIDYAIKNKLVDIKFQELNTFGNDNKKIYEIITILRSEQGEELYPNDYSRVANKTNKFLQIDECSFEKICSILDSVLSHSNKLGYILIRISVQALEDETFLDRIVELLRRHDVPYKYICFEITNANAIIKKDVLLKNITYMQRLGISFAMGGFGSGESNLNYFIDLPMDIVKFDQSILKNAIKDPRAAMIMKNVTDLAHTLGFSVIAVGAKTEEEINFVKTCNIEMAIGDQFTDILNENDFINELSIGGVN